MNVVAWADTSEHFCERVKQTATELDCILLELEKVKLLDERMEESDFPEELITMRTTAHRQQNDVVFGTFYTWSQDDAN